MYFSSPSGQMEYVLMIVLQGEMGPQIQAHFKLCLCCIGKATAQGKPLSQAQSNYGRALKVT